MNDFRFFPIFAWETWKMKFLARNFNHLCIRLKFFGCKHYISKKYTSNSCKRCKPYFRFLHDLECWNFSSICAIVHGFLTFFIHFIKFHLVGVNLSPKRAFLQLFKYPIRKKNTESWGTLYYLRIAAKVEKFTSCSSVLFSDWHANPDHLFSTCLSQ